MTEVSENASPEVPFGNAYSRMNSISTRDRRRLPVLFISCCAMPTRRRHPRSCRHEVPARVLGDEVPL
jgi:hypothetical protein